MSDAPAPAALVGFGAGGVSLPYAAHPVGSAACAPCHREHVEQARTNRMAQTSALVTPATRARWFDDARLRADLDWPAAEPSGPPRYRPRADGVAYETRDAQGGSVRADVLAVLGSGHRGFTPIALGAGGIRELRLSFFAGAARWRLTPGSEGDPDPLGHVRSAETSRQCLGCHATAVAWGEAGLDVERSVFGIGCERCHGPGGAHTGEELGEEGSWRIFNPGRLARAESVRFCAQCHREPADLEPHKVLARDASIARHAGASLMLSACFRASPPEATITCLDCHDPHRKVEERVADTDRVCRRCHADPAALHPAAGAAAAADCVSCHLSRETEGFFGLEFTDHWIRVPAPRGALPPAERAALAALLEDAYRRALAAARERALVEEGAKLGMRLGKLLLAGDRVEEGLGELRASLALAPLYKDRIIAAELHEEAGRRDEAIRILEDAARHAPENNRAYHMLAQLHVGNDDFAAAAAALARWRAARPDDPHLAAAERELAALRTQLERPDEGGTAPEKKR